MRTIVTKAVIDKIAGMKKTGDETGSGELDPARAGSAMAALRLERERTLRRAGALGVVMEVMEAMTDPDPSRGEVLISTLADGLILDDGSSEQDRAVTHALSAVAGCLDAMETALGRHPIDRDDISPVLARIEMRLAALEEAVAARPGAPVVVPGDTAFTVPTLTPRKSIGVAYAELADPYFGVTVPEGRTGYADGIVSSAFNHDAARFIRLRKSDDWRRMLAERATAFASEAAGTGIEGHIDDVDDVVDDVADVAGVSEVPAAGASSDPSDEGSYEDLSRFLTSVVEGASEDSYDERLDTLVRAATVVDEPKVGDSGDISDGAEDPAAVKSAPVRLGMVELAARAREIIIEEGKPMGLNDIAERLKASGVHPGAPGQLGHALMIRGFQRKGKVWWPIGVAQPAC